MPLATNASRSANESTSEVDGQPGASAVERLEAQLLEGDAVGHALPREGLHDELVLAQLVEDAVESGLEAVAADHVAVRAAGAGVPAVDRRAALLRAGPLREQLGVDVRAVDLVGRRVELADDADQRHLGVDDDLGLVGHGAHSFSPVGVIGHVAQQGVEAAVPLLGLALVALDPFGHQVEDLRFEMHGTALRVAGARHEPGVLEHPQVLRHRLHRDLVRLGELVDGGIGDREPGDHVAPGRVRQCREHPRECICRHVHLPCSTIRLITGCRARRPLSTLRLNTSTRTRPTPESGRVHAIRAHLYARIAVIRPHPRPRAQAARTRSRKRSWKR